MTNAECRTIRVASALIALAALVACGPRAQEYPVQGQIIAVSADHRQLTIDHKDIPNFMPAMTMAYFVKDPHELDGVAAGDLATATLVVNGSEIYLRNIKKTGHADLPAGAHPVKAMDVMNPDDTVDRTINNRRYEPWAARALWGTLPLILLGVVVALTANVATTWKIVTVSVAVGAIPVWVYFLVRVGKRRPVSRIKLGDEIAVFPSGGLVPLDRVQDISFAPDPDEDYHDSAMPFALCEVRLVLRPGGDFRLIATVADGRRVRDWAVRWGIAVSDPAAVLVASRSDGHTGPIDS